MYKCCKPEHLHCKFCDYKTKSMICIKNHIKTIHKYTEKTEITKIVNEIAEKGKQLSKGK